MKRCIGLMVFGCGLLGGGEAAAQLDFQPVGAIPQTCRINLDGTPAAGFEERTSSLV